MRYSLPQLFRPRTIVAYVGAPPLSDPPNPPSNARRREQRQSGSARQRLRPA